MIGWRLSWHWRNGSSCLPLHSHIFKGNDSSVLEWRRKTRKWGRWRICLSNISRTSYNVGTKTEVKKRVVHDQQSGMAGQGNEKPNSRGGCSETYAGVWWRETDEESRKRTRGRKQHRLPPIMVYDGWGTWGKKGLHTLRGWVLREGRAEEWKKEGKVVWGQRWLPVCLWNTSQLAFTVNAGKNRVPKSGQQEWVTGPEGGGKKGGDSYWREVRCLKWHACGWRIWWWS